MKIFRVVISLFILAVVGFSVPRGVMADQVVADDQIVTGSLCVGFDCLTDNTENFGFDTIRLKENNLRIDFMDTSNTAGFPTNDWRIQTNDSASGGGNYFAVLDAGSDGSAGNFVLRINAGAQGGVALGSGSSSGNNGVALGAGSVAADNTVSVGSAGNERRVTNVADGVDDTDAANMGQLRAAAFETSAGLSDRIDDLSDRVDRVEKKAYSGVAAAVAMAAVPEPRTNHRFSMGMGVGTYAGQNAIAVGAKANMGEHLRVSGGVGYSSGNTAVSAGVGFSW